jgi:DNA-binding PadR family transcriptional regulator
LAKINKNKFIILGIISMKPASGYDIKKWVEETFSFFWDMSYGQIYPTLESLEKDGLVEKTVAIEEGRPIKHLYEITNTGREELKSWMELPVEEEKCRYEILVKFFGYLMPTEANIKIIEEFRDKKIKELKILDDYDCSIEDHRRDRPECLYPMLTLMMGKHSFKASIAWADEAIELLKQNDAKSNLNKNENI